MIFRRVAYWADIFTLETWVQGQKRDWQLTARAAAGDVRDPDRERARSGERSSLGSLPS
jgi:hypothetical protein